MNRVDKTFDEYFAVYFILSCQFQKYLVAGPLWGGLRWPKYTCNLGRKGELMHQEKYECISNHHSSLNCYWQKTNKMHKWRSPKDRRICYVSQDLKRNKRLTKTLNSKSIMYKKKDFMGYSKQMLQFWIFSVQLDWFSRMLHTSLLQRYYNVHLSMNAHVNNKLKLQIFTHAYLAAVQLMASSFRRSHRSGTLCDSATNGSRKTCLKSSNSRIADKEILQQVFSD